MYQEQICTPIELKEFISAQGDIIKAYDLSAFIELKSNCRYTIVELDFMFSVLDTLSEQAIVSNNIHNKFKKKWCDKYSLLV